MNKQYYEIAVVDSDRKIADESVDEVFRLTFINDKRSKRSTATTLHKLTIFFVESKKIDSKKVKKFEDFLRLNGFVKLDSIIYTDLTTEVSVCFFTIKLNSQHFSDMRELLISKIETALGSKLKVYGYGCGDVIYYYHLTKTQIKSRRFVWLLNRLLDNPCIEIIAGF